MARNSVDPLPRYSYYGRMPETTQAEITLAQLPAKLRSRLSAHRGYGSPQNSTKSIRAALEAGFVMVEFDVLLDNGQWWVGHAIDDDLNETLADALALFRDNQIVPKVDFKLAVDQFVPETFQAIYQELARFPGPKCVNLSHRGQTVIDDTHPESFFGAQDYIHAEQLMYDLRPKQDTSVMLNLDLQRYKQHAGVSDEEIVRHIHAIKPIVDSLSPELTMPDIIEASYAVAQQCGIRTIYGWLHREMGHTITIEEAEAFHNDALARGLQPVLGVDFPDQIRV